jgi:hypothetical protein
MLQRAIALDSTLAMTAAPKLSDRLGGSLQRHHVQQEALTSDDAAAASRRAFAFGLGVAGGR